MARPQLNDSGNHAAIASIIWVAHLPAESEAGKRMALNQKQRKIVGTLWSTYALFYFGRVNMSVVLPLIALELSVGRAEVGILGTVFFWAYALGNFVCGELGNHLRPFRLIGCGLLASALLNLAFGFQSTLLVMLALWALNGLAQSAAWSPMVRILAERLNTQQAKRFSTIMPYSYVFGTVLTWMLIGALAGGENWRAGFWLPGAVLLLGAVLWWKAGIDAPKSKSSGIRIATMISDARAVSFALAVAALSGFVRNGSIIWLPSFILDTGLISDSLVGSVAALTQLIAIAGIFLAHQGVKRSNKVLQTAVLLLGAAGLGFLALTVTRDALSIALVSFAIMMLNGAFGLVTSSMPLLLAPPGRASSIAGAMNMMATLAGGVAGFSIGGLVELSGWGAVFGLWGICLLLAALVVWRHRAAETSVAGAAQP